MAKTGTVIGRTFMLGLTALSLYASSLIRQQQPKNVATRDSPVAVTTEAQQVTFQKALDKKLVSERDKFNESVKKKQSFGDTAYSLLFQSALYQNGGTINTTPKTSYVGLNESGTAFNALVSNGNNADYVMTGTVTDNGKIGTVEVNFNHAEK